MKKMIAVAALAALAVLSAGAAPASANACSDAMAKFNATPKPGPHNGCQTAQCLGTKTKNYNDAKAAAEKACGKKL